MEHNKDHKDKKDKHKRDKTKEVTRSPSSGDVGDLLSKQTDIVHNLKLEDTVCDFVTVYSDRAEITRTLKVAVEKEGVQQIVLSGLSENVDQNSVRVSGGAGKATILEVAYEQKYITEPASTPSQQKLDRIAEIDAQVGEINASLERVRKERDWLSTYSQHKAVVGEHNKLTLDEVSAFMNFYQDQLERLDKKFRGFNAEVTKLNKEKAVLTAEMNANRLAVNYWTRQVTISLYSPGSTNLTLQVSYVVSGASWQSSYDVRVTTKTDDGKPKCALQYYGVITNGTGENWNNVSMALSTARPSLGGQPPKLPTCVIKFKDELLVTPRSYTKTLQRRTSISMMVNDEEENSRSRHRSNSALPVDEPAMQIMGTQVEKGMGSATYRIPRAATIEADNKPHKVSIVILDLNVAISYETVPVLSPNAYMKAVAKNVSEYQLLPGQMNVFLDNFFLAQSALKHTNPSEEITLYLGVDEMIQVELKPQEQLAGK
eukprot:TRINITY_DN3828_c0_g1_i1.p1 TRINITY_DN3828_c0_g1~~TRINITY_DN3828_c0_g1_i1.p1  ORF type:complete len:487 (+),score=161.09 TRINITY_DN3828_c0_g1_i1:691-2151(+)